jgi:hypothetical protein
MRDGIGHGRLATGNSTTTSSAQAASIQLNSKGITAVDGLLANGFSHGSAMHNANMPACAGVSFESDKFMR